jgi:hypothetical protein
VKSCERDLQRLRERRLTYQPAQRMTVDQSSDVVVLLSNGPTVGITLPGTSPTTVVKVQTPCFVSAELAGAAFTISPNGPQQQSFTTQSTLIWKWTVIPSREGRDLELDLTLQPVFVLPGGVPDPGPDNRFVKTITVTAVRHSASRRILAFVSNPVLLSLTGAVITGLLTAGATIWLTRRDEQKRRKNNARGKVGAGKQAATASLSRQAQPRGPQRSGPPSSRT